MKIVLTCGHNRSGCHAVHELLANSGLGLASPSRRENMSPATLQTEIFKYYEQDPDALDAVRPIQPGKVWHDLAADLLMGNLDKQNWGWADSRTLSLLDFWRQLDSQIRFLFVYSAPEYAVAQMIGDKDATPENIEQAARSWCAANSEMMAFFHRHPERCILANTLAIAQTPRDFIAGIGAQWELRLHLNDASELSEEMEAQSVGARLLKPLLNDLHEVTALYDELESSTHFASSGAETDRAEIRRGWYHYRRAACDARELQGAHDRLVDEHTKLSQQNALIQLQIHEIQEKLEQEHLKSTGERESLINARDEQSTLAGERLQQLTLLKTQFDELAEIRDQQRKIIEEAKHAAEASRPNTEFALLESRVTELARENELLLLRLHEAQEELEHQYLKATEERGSLIKARDEQATLAAEYLEQLALFKSQCDELAKIRGQQLQIIEEAKQRAKASRPDTEFTLLESRVKELSRENELLLLQLHQLQEELEHYLATPAVRGSCAPHSDTWSHHHPHTMVWDMRSAIAGDNWYHAEADGRWTGPGLVSTVTLPRLRDGQYELELDIVDTMAPEILNEMELAINGHRLSLSGESLPLPVVFKAAFSTFHFSPEADWALQFKFPHMVSPSEYGSDDSRLLGIRLRSIKLTRSLESD